ncbi:MAG: hypothetical protein AABY54_00640 [Deltaproteobacteria bacterium]
MEAFLILLIFAGVIALIGSSFFRGTTEVWESTVTDSRLNRLKSTKDSYYTAMKDVDFENAEGKLSEKDYIELRDYYKEKAIMTIKEMEKIKAAAPHPKGIDKEKAHTKGNR